MWVSFALQGYERDLYKYRAPQVLQIGKLIFNEKLIISPLVAPDSMLNGCQQKSENLQTHRTVTNTDLERSIATNRIFLTSLIQIFHPVEYISISYINKIANF